MATDRPTSADHAILLTPQGTGAIAVIRLAGERVGRFLRAHFSRPAVEGRPVHGTITDAGRMLDEAVVVLHGEGFIADVNVHGGQWVIAKLLELARKEGFELLEWRASGHADRTAPVPLPPACIDADDDIEREMLAWLPYARTETAVRMLLAQPPLWRAMLAAPPAAEELDRILADRSLLHLLRPPRVAIVGLPNAGKSTLANRLIGRERSITADMPGTTRDWVGELADVGGLVVMLIDTPGVRIAGDPLERMALERSAGEIERADMVLLVLDASVPLEGPQQELLTAWPDALRIANKIDKPRRWEPSDAGAVAVAAVSGQGIDGLRPEILRRFGCADPDIRRPRWWTERQQFLLEDLRRNAASSGDR